MAETRKFYAFRRRGLNIALETERTARLDVTLDTNEGERTSSVSLPLMGPGDVQGLVKGAVTRRWPEPNSTKTPAGSVAYVEFADDDLPWLLSPKSSVRPMPWLTLLVLPDAPDSGLTWRADGMPLPEILIDASLSGTLPDPEEAWILAHTEARRAETFPEFYQPGGWRPVRGGWPCWFRFMRPAGVQVSMKTSTEQQASQ